MDKSSNIFSISDLESLSGIKAHTIRIWEKRYRILEPDRTDSNIRTYGESELKKILNIAYLNRNGIKISHIASLGDDELCNKVMELGIRNEKQGKDPDTDRIIRTAIRFNENKLKEILFSVISDYGMEHAYPEILYPLLLKARLLWQTGTLSRAQEQFIRSVIKQMIIVEDNAVAFTGKEKPSVAVISTSEYHSENNFLFYKYILKKNRFDVIFSGGVLPASEVAEIHKIKPFSVLIIDSGPLQLSAANIEYFSNLGRSLLVRKILFADYNGFGLARLPENIITSSDPEDFNRKIPDLKM